MLVAGQIAGSAALAAAVTVGAFVIQDILGQDTPWGGLASATVTMGTAVTSQVLSRIMSGRTRRIGLQTGYLLAIVGGCTAGAGAEFRSLPLFLVGLFLFGNGQASNLLSRFAATDLAEPDQRARAMSRILFASTFGAVFGPVLIQPAQTAGETWFGWGRYTGPWVFAGVFFLTSLLNATVRLRPDPLTVARGTSSPADVRRREPVRLGSAFRDPDARLALLSMVVSQMSMVSVMTMTPVHLKAHGHEATSPYVISLHIAGMFAFSPLVGRLADRAGRHATILVGALTLVLATVLAAMSGDDAGLLFPALWLLGLGWSCGLIGGSSLLVDSVPERIRVGVQGRADLLMSLLGGASGFLSGFIRQALGYHVLALVGTALAGVLAAGVVWRRGTAPVPA
ncbi:MAG: MFS transporter [Acidobacteria bacterium]|nr:MFS transporter [Acidobacteriota bacterium]